MAISYPVGPTAVPDTLTQPPATYRRRVWMALGGLLLFVALYVLLTGWLGWTAYRLINAAIEGGGDAFWGALVGACAAFLTVFMVKGLFFMERGRNDESELEVTQAEEPELFAFLHRLADDAKAPRPHRVFLSPRVNASVSYDISLLNLIFPSKKNLEIGLGLVNVLTLGELKAVLAHEFGHFAQRSMAVGRWVFMAQQIAGHIVASRGRLDNFVIRLSNLDLRIAWIGWALSLIIWAIRSMVDSVFSLALRMQRALSREMEMHADLVAVSLTGSDPLMYALHRLRTADDAWDRTLGFAGSQLSQGHAIRDLFAIQSTVIERMSTLLDDESYRAPELPTTRPDAFRLFKAELAQPPRMWSTHPANDEREANAKRVYIAAPADDRSGWLLFRDAQRLREKVSRLTLGKQEGATVMETDAAVARLDEQFGRESLDRRYRGVYLDRSVARPAKRPAQLYAASLDGALEQLQSLYPESLSRDLERLRTVEKEAALLEAVSDGVLEATGGVIRHRGRTIRPTELPQVIAQLEEERSRIQQKLWTHDRKCRTAHRAAAAKLGNGWEEYLCGLAAVHHYADHAEENILDAQRALRNRVAIATADGRVGKKDIARVLEAAKDLHAALVPVFIQKDDIVLDPTLIEQLGAESWAAMVEEFKLGEPEESNIGDWLDVVDGWVNTSTGPLGALRHASLDLLLKREAEVARWVTDGIEPPAAPPASRVPDEYPVFMPGDERRLVRKLPLWKRFRMADGVVPATLRFLVAASIIGAVLGFGGQMGEATVMIYNGLGRPVTVAVGEEKVRVEAFSNHAVTLPPGVHRLRTTTADGAPVEALPATVERGFGSYVYNVASAGTLVEWTQTYGNAKDRPSRELGAPRWTETNATVLFEDPPESMSSRSGGSRVLVLSGVSRGSPSRVLGLIDNPRAHPTVIAAHARWDLPRQRYTLMWLMLARDLPGFRELVAARLADDSTDMLALRAEQDAVTGEQHNAVCLRHLDMADAAPDDANMQYLAARCIPDEAERNAAFVALSEEFPKNGWMNFAAGYALAEESRWAEALPKLEAAYKSEPAIGAIAADMIARLRRMVQGADANLDDVVAASDELAQLASLESGEGWEGSPYEAYGALAHGELKEAMALARRSGGGEQHLVPLIAASDGAEAEWVEQAMAITPDSSLGATTAWTLLALAAREQRDLGPYIALAKQRADDGELLVNFVEMLRSGSDPAAAERSLGLVSPAGRGLAWSMGCVMLGRQAPADWCEGAKRMLFASERPYFR